jgi:hypothetical protein
MTFTGSLSTINRAKKRYFGCNSGVEEINGRITSIVDVANQKLSGSCNHFSASNAA